MMISFSFGFLFLSAILYINTNNKIPLLIASILHIILSFAKMIISYIKKTSFLWG